MEAWIGGHRGVYLFIVGVGDFGKVTITFGKVTITPEKLTMASEKLTIACQKLTMTKK